ncbi:MAG: B12-binding domain-containing radical SAM protein [Nanoarchaeota archaeon]|nr:B12-binding domain-containing radical SAM protein [Nanoarchaeota archaeon]
MRYKSGDPPLGIASIASYLQNKGINVKILDTTFNRSLSYVKNFLLDYKPKVVGIYIDTPMYNDAMNIIHLLKRLNIFVIAGGPHATIMPETLINNVDVVIIGEGEETFYHIIKNKNNLSAVSGIWYKDSKSIIKTKPRKPIINLDKLPPPQRKFFDMENYIKNWHYLDNINPKLRGTTFIASRGCKYNCTFCQPTLKKIFGDIIRKRSPENVIQEIIDVRDKYNLDMFFMHDDTLTEDKEWLKRFCELLEEKKVNMMWGCNARLDNLDEETLNLLYGSKLRMVHLGIESASQRILDKIYNKGISIKDVKSKLDLAQKIGVKVLCFFMLGAPTETRKEINQTIRFAASLKCSEASFSVVNALPYTYLYHKVKEDYTLEDDFEKYNYYSGRAFHDPDMPDRMLKYYLFKSLLYFYLHPYRWPYIFNHLTSFSGWYKMVIKIRRFI